MTPEMERFLVNVAQIHKIRQKSDLLVELVLPMLTSAGESACRGNGKHLKEIVKSSEQQLIMCIQYKPFYKRIFKEALMSQNDFKPTQSANVKISFMTNHSRACDPQMSVHLLVQLPPA